MMMMMELSQTDFLINAPTVGIEELPFIYSSSVFEELFANLLVEFWIYSVDSIIFNEKIFPEILIRMSCLSIGRLENIRILLNPKTFLRKHTNWKLIFTVMVHLIEERMKRKWNVNEKKIFSNFICIHFQSFVFFFSFVNGMEWMKKSRWIKYIYTSHIAKQYYCDYDIFHAIYFHMYA